MTLFPGRYWRLAGLAVVAAASLAAAAEPEEPSADAAPEETRAAEPRSADPLRPVAAQLEAKYGVKLESAPAKCGCYEYAVTRKVTKDKKEKTEKLGTVKPEAFGRGCGEAETALESGVRRALSLPSVSSGTATDAERSGFGISITSEAQALMAARGMSLAGGLLHAGTKKRVADVDLDADGKTQSVAFRVDEADARVLVIATTNDDGSRDVVRIVDGRAVR